MAIAMFDNVRVVSTPVTISLGLAGLTGQVLGETTPSITGVQVIGSTAGDHAINVQFDGVAESQWFSPDLLEFVDHAPGTEVRVDDKRRVRTKSGDWIDG